MRGVLGHHPSKRLKTPLRRSSRPFPPTYGFGVCVPVVSSPLLSFKVLRSLELGLVKWGDSFDHLKVQFLTPSSLLSEIAPRKVAKPPGNGESITAPPKPAIPRHQICDEWSWYNNCSSTDCPRQHVCVVCKRSDRQALACPKRKFPVPARRTDSPSQA